MNRSILTLCLVTQMDHRSLDEYLQFLELAVKGGVTLVQLRDKTSPLSLIKHRAIAFKSLLDRLGIPLIINDHVELALEINADGVHIGKSDLSPLEARLRLGPDKIIGYSIASYEDLQQANQLTCIDYVAASAVFPSKNKHDCQTIWGLTGLKNLVDLSNHPVVAIGSINLGNVSEVMKQGACGIAVISAIHDHFNAQLAAEELIKIIQEEKSDV